MIDKGCEWTRQLNPATYSRADTVQTQAEVKRSAAEVREHNAARDAVCDSVPRKPLV